MASSLTPKLGLSVWESEDMLTMDEFNQNHLALEEKLGRLAEFTLLDTTLTQSASAISVAVNVSAWAEFDYIYVDWDFSSNHPEYITGLRLNGSNSSDQTYGCFYSDFRELYYGSTFMSMNCYSSINRTRFNVRKNLSNRVVVSSESDYVFSWGVYKNLTYSKIQSLTFACSQSSQVFNSGGHVRIWGVK